MFDNKLILCTFVLLSVFNVQADDRANVTVNPPQGFVIASKVSYASQNVPSMYGKILFVLGDNKEDSHTLNIGDIVLINTFLDFSEHVCDYFQVIDSGSATVNYTNLVSDNEPAYKLDNENVLNLVYHKKIGYDTLCIPPVQLKEALDSN